MRQSNAAVASREPQVRPLRSTEEQARILRAAATRLPDGEKLVLDEDFTLEPWECTLLYREGQADRQARDLARTLLRARAAEWAVRRRLRSGKDLDARSAQAASLLLDNALADIGAVSEPASNEAAQKLEIVAERLADLYASFSALSLRLMVQRERDTGDPRWLLDKLDEDEFEMGSFEAERFDRALHAAAEDTAPIPSLPDLGLGPDPFDLVQDFDAGIVTAASVVEPPPARPESAPVAAMRLVVDEEALSIVEGDVKVVAAAVPAPAPAVVAPAAEPVVVREMPASAPAPVKKGKGLVIALVVGAVAIAGVLVALLH